jgi:hypothetical protein
LAIPAFDASNQPDIGFIFVGQELSNTVDVTLSAHQNQTDPHVEGAKHFFVRDAAAILKNAKDGRDRPRLPVNPRAAVRRQNPWKVVSQATSGNVCHSLHQPGREEWHDDAQVGSVRRQEHIRNG